MSKLAIYSDETPYFLTESHYSSKQTQRPIDRSVIHTHTYLPEICSLPALADFASYIYDHHRDLHTWN